MKGYVADLTCYWEMPYGLHYKTTPNFLCGYFEGGGCGGETPCIRDDTSITQCRVLGKLAVAPFVKKINVLDLKFSPCSECCIVFLVGDSPPSEFYLPTFRNTICSFFLGGVSKHRHIKFRRRGITQKKEYKINVHYGTDNALPCSRQPATETFVKLD